MNQTETKTKEYFKSIGISLTKISEGIRKTPDFKGKEILVEVKEILPQELEGLQGDTTYNAVKNSLKDAAEKFDQYDSKHNKKHIIIIFFSEENGYKDIEAVCIGRIHPLIYLRGGMTLSNHHQKHIDAIFWFEEKTDSKPKKVLFFDNITKKYFEKINL